jgi:hypothetical protein
MVHGAMPAVSTCNEEAGEDGKKLGIRGVPKQHTSVETRWYSLPWEIGDCGVV